MLREFLLEEKLLFSITMSTNVSDNNNCNNIFNGGEIIEIVDSKLEGRGQLL